MSGNTDAGADRWWLVVYTLAHVHINIYAVPMRRVGTRALPVRPHLLVKETTDVHGRRSLTFALIQIGASVSVARPCWSVVRLLTEDNLILCCPLLSLLSFLSHAEAQRRGGGRARVPTRRMRTDATKRVPPVLPVLRGYVFTRFTDAAHRSRHGEDIRHASLFLHPHFAGGAFFVQAVVDGDVLAVLACEDEGAALVGDPPFTVFHLRNRLYGL